MKTNNTAEGAGGTGMSRILVIDDETDICILYAEELAEEGYEVFTASSTSEAVEMLQQMEFDLVVLDIKLKNESGIDLLQRIVNECREMPVILCSAFSCYKDDFSAWLADGYVVKSGDLSELKQEIARVLAKRAQRMQTVRWNPKGEVQAPELRR